jgi:hypothetical protein
MSLTPSTKFSLGTIVLLIVGLIVVIFIAYFVVTPHVS